jgi:uncharacterized membrane protein
MHGRSLIPPAAPSLPSNYFPDNVRPSRFPWAPAVAALVLAASLGWAGPAEAQQSGTRGGGADWLSGSGPSFWVGGAASYQGGAPAECHPSRCG